VAANAAEAVTMDSAHAAHAALMILCTLFPPCTSLPTSAEVGLAIGLRHESGDRSNGDAVPRNA
jgi:hypothetical protein